MKKVFSLILVVMMVMGVGFTQSVFAEDSSAVSDINALGIMQGYPDGTFGEDNHITRAEMAKVIVRTLGISDASEYMSLISARKVFPFTDVESTHWAYNFIEVASHLKIISGNGDGTFLPDNSVTYAEVIKMIVCVLGYEPKVEAMGMGYPTGYAKIAADLGVTEGIAFVLENSATRGNIAKMIHTALDIPIMEQTNGDDNTIAYTIMDGQNGVDLKTLRTERHTTSDLSGQGGSSGSSKGEIVVPVE